MSLLKFLLDGKSAPWSKGHGFQERYDGSVENWLPYHTCKTDNNPNEFPGNVRGTILNFQLYGCARDVVCCVASGKLQSSYNASFIVDAIFNRDPLAVLADMYAKLNYFVSARRRSNRLFSKYLLRLSALVSKLDSDKSSISHPEYITAFMLMASAVINDSHRVSIVAVAANDIAAEADVKASSCHSSADLVNNVRSETVASILRQREKPNSSNLPAAL